jgi:lipopolysaccharide transport system permease protein
MMVARIWSHRHLVFSLVRRQYHLRYRQSFAGFTWALIPPLVTLGVAALVFDNVVRVDTQGVPYALFTMAALVPWTFFASSLTFGVPSVVGAMTMVTRLPFPRASLPLSMIGLSLLDLAVATGLFLIFAMAIGNGVTVTALWFPLLLVIELALVCGLVLLGSALNVFARDVRLAVPLAVQFWLFVTPVMYSLQNVPDGLRPWYLANPMTGIVESSRVVLVYGQSPELALIIPSVIGAVVVLVLGLWYFGGTESRFADAI